MFSLVVVTTSCSNFVCYTAFAIQTSLYLLISYNLLVTYAKFELGFLYYMFKIHRGKKRNG